MNKNPFEPANFMYNFYQPATDLMEINHPYKQYRIIKGLDCTYARVWKLDEQNKFALLMPFVKIFKQYKRPSPEFLKELESVRDKWEVQREKIEFPENVFIAEHGMATILKPLRRTR